MLDNLAMKVELLVKIWWQTKYNFETPILLQAELKRICKRKKLNWKYHFVDRCLFAVIHWLIAAEAPQKWIFENWYCFFAVLCIFFWMALIIIYVDVEKWFFSSFYSFLLITANIDSVTLRKPKQSRML